MELLCSEQEVFLNSVKLKTVKGVLNWCHVYKNRIMHRVCKIITIFCWKYSVGLIEDLGHWALKLGSFADVKLLLNQTGLSLYFILKSCVILLNRNTMRNGLKKSRVRNFDGTTLSGWRWWRVGRWMTASSICMGTIVLSPTSTKGTFWKDLTSTTTQVRQHVLVFSTGIAAPFVSVTIACQQHWWILARDVFALVRMLMKDWALYIHEFTKCDRSLEMWIDLP